MNGEPFPLNFDDLKRGDYLPPEDVEKATLTSRSDHKAFRIRALQLCKQIRGHFLRTLGDTVTVVFDGDGLRILTHQEQFEHAPKRADQALRQIALSQQEASAVDVRQLSDEQREQHDRFIRKNSWRLQQIRKPPPPELKG